MVQGIGETNLGPQKKQIKEDAQTAKGLQKLTALKPSQLGIPSPLQTSDDIIDVSKPISALFEELDKSLEEINELQDAQDENSTVRLEELRKRAVTLQNLITANQGVNNLDEAAKLMDLFQKNLPANLKDSHNISSDNVLRLLK